MTRVQKMLGKFQQAMDRINMTLVVQDISSRSSAKQSRPQAQSQVGPLITSPDLYEGVIGLSKGKLLKN